MLGSTNRIGCHYLLLLSLLGVSAFPSSAATFVVTKDGTGDFDAVFDAIEAAADGDTIRIRAGEYMDLRTENLIGIDFLTLGVVTQSSLTIIGDGRDEVFLGPQVRPTSGPDVVVLVSTLESGTVWISGVTVRNGSNRGIAVNGDGVFIRDCRVVDSVPWLVSSTCRISTVIERSEFRGPADGVAITEGQGAIQAFVRDSTFDLAGPLGLSSQTQIFEVSNCDFANSGEGLSVQPGVQASIDKCTFRNNNRAIVVNGNSIADITNCYVAPGCGTSLDAPGALGVVTGNRFMGGTFATVYLRSPDAPPAFFQGNHIINDGGWSLRAQRRTPPVQGVMDVDFSGNYWGTNDEFQITDWIYDIRDDASNFIRVEWRPIEGGPVSSETTSFGDLKARFGGDEN